MNKGRIEGAADQGERAQDREALVTKGRRRKELMALGASIDVAAPIAANTRRCWRNSGMLLNSILDRKWADRLKIPRLC